MITPPSPKGAVRLGFPTIAAEQWLPRLWVEMAGGKGGIGDRAIGLLGKYGH